jgi:hypothetical protein
LPLISPQSAAAAISAFAMLIIELRADLFSFRCRRFRHYAIIAISRRLRRRHCAFAIIDTRRRHADASHSPAPCFRHEPAMPRAIDFGYSRH